MRLSDYEELFSESLLIVPIAEYLRGKRWTVEAEIDCYKLLNKKKEKGLAGNVNYDIYAQKGEAATSEQIILEMKFMKKASHNAMKRSNQKKTGSYAERFLRDNPGSPAAVKRGCTCHASENNYGRGWTEADVKEPVFRPDPACMLHGLDVLAGMFRERKLH
jgi:hypothetical protein